MPNETWMNASVKLEACLAGIGACTSMSTLNKEKTELIILKPKHRLKAGNKIQLLVGEKTVYGARSTNDIDVYSDASLTTVNAISSVPVTIIFVIRLDNLSTRLRQRSLIWSHTCANGTSAENTVQVSRSIPENEGT